MKRLTLLVASTSALMISQLSHAAAFQFYELGTPVIGTAGVGQTTVNDASSSYFNPAAMTTLKTSQVMLGTEIILPYTNFSPDNSTTILGNNGGNAGQLIPAVGGYYVYSVDPRLKLGVSLTSPYGGDLNYNNHWVGRYVVQQMQLFTINLNPSVAYQVNSWFSVGAGFSVEYANLYQTVAVPVDPGLIDGQVTLKADNVSPGFNIGMLFTPYETTKIGIAYRSQIIHDLRGSIDFLNLSVEPSASTKLVMPANIIASIDQAVNKQFNVLGELGWSNWSSMRNTIVQVNDFSGVTPQNWDDTYRIGLAGEYQFNSPVLVHAGISYDSSPTTSSKRQPDLPMDRQIRVGAGLEYRMMQIAALGLSYEYINFGDADINNTTSNGTLSGSYSRNFANVFQASLNVDV